MTARRSLRRRLMLLVAATTILAWGVTAALVYRDAHEQADRTFDDQLAQSAELLLRQAAHEIDEVAEDREHAEDEDEWTFADHAARASEIAFQIWSGGGRLLYRSRADLPAAHLSRGGPGYADVRVGGAAWRVYVLETRSGRLRIEIGQPHARRTERARRLAVNVLQPLAVALPLLLLAIWLALGRALQPLRRLAAQVSARQPQDLAPLDTPVPAEIAPLTVALNDLFARVAAALQRERRFTADAAHELRTPLAGMKTQAQVAQVARDDNERQAALRQLVIGLDRASHLVDELLQLARLDAGAAEPADLAPCDLAALVAEVVAELGDAARDRQLELRCETAGPAIVAGDAALLRALVRNLVDNAVRYTPPRGAVEVDVARSDGRVTLRVCDTGPGVPPDQLTRLGDRFFRVLGSGQAGSGLGLAIARRIAERHGATVELRNRSDRRGLVALVGFMAG